MIELVVAIIFGIIIGLSLNKDDRGRCIRAYPFTGKMPKTPQPKAHLEAKP